MKVKLYTSIDFKTSNWSGGTTTQLYISPDTAKYADLNFDIRISSAKVEVAESTFTNLPKVNRQLMILEGEITIAHKDKYTKRLKPLDVDTFQGDWNTTSKGVCTDFNVMTTGNAASELSGLALASNQSKKVHMDEQWDTFFIYLFSGKVSVKIADKDNTINGDSLLVIEEAKLADIYLFAHEDSRLALVGYKKQ